MKNKIDFYDILEIAMLMVEDNEYTGNIDEVFTHRISGYNWNDFSIEELKRLRFYEDNGNKFYLTPLMLKLTEEGTLLKRRIDTVEGFTEEDYIFDKLDEHETTGRDDIEFDSPAITEYFVQK